MAVRLQLQCHEDKLQAHFDIDLVPLALKDDRVIGSRILICVTNEDERHTDALT